MVLYSVFRKHRLGSSVGLNFLLVGKFIYQIGKTVFTMEFLTVANTLYPHNSKQKKIAKTPDNNFHKSRLDNFKNIQKSIYCKSIYIFWKLIQFSIHWDKPQMLRMGDSEPCYMNWSRCVSLKACGIFHFLFHFVFIRVCIFVQQKA